MDKTVNGPIVEYFYAHPSEDTSPTCGNGTQRSAVAYNLLRYIKAQRTFSLRCQDSSNCFAASISLTCSSGFAEQVKRRPLDGIKRGDDIELPQVKAYQYVYII